MKSIKNEENGCGVLHQQYNTIPCALASGGKRGYQRSCHSESEGNGLLSNTESSFNSGGLSACVVCVCVAKYLNSKLYGAAFCVEQSRLNGCSRRSRNPWFPYPLTVWLLKWFCLVLND